MCEVCLFLVGRYLDRGEEHFKPYAEKTICEREVEALALSLA